ncbi:hypothetical protein LUI62_42560, partial [Bradyrhizobium diazoefficiens]
MLMIWSSRDRNRSFEPVVLCFFGRIGPSDAAQNHGSQRQGNPKSKLQVFAVKPQSPAISNAAATGKQTLNQVLGGLFTDN